MYISVDAVARVRSGESGELNLVVVPQKSSTENPAATSTYVNSTYGIRVYYPSDWTIQVSKPSGTLINIATFVSPTGPNSNPTADIAIYIDRLHNSTTNLNNYAQYSLDGYKNFFSAFKLLKLNTHSTLDGHSAYALVGIYQDSSFGLQKLMEVGTIIGNKAYYVQYIADAPRYSDYLPVLQNMINSLQITSYPVPTLSQSPTYNMPGAGGSTNMTGTYIDKGIALGSLGNYTGAIEYYDKALAIDPHFVPALTGKSIALYNLGNYTGAILYDDKALAIDPNNTHALNSKDAALDKLETAIPASNTTQPTPISPTPLAVVKSIVEDAIQAIQGADTTDKALRLMNFANQQLSPVGNSTSIEEAKVFLGYAIKSLQNHDVGTTLERLNIADQNHLRLFHISRHTAAYYADGLTVKPLTYYFVSKWSI
jgi:tetratricopeptide (TPR) repeat protein